MLATKAPNKRRTKKQVEKLVPVYHIDAAYMNPRSVADLFAHTHFDKARAVDESTFKNIDDGKKYSNTFQLVDGVAMYAITFVNCTADSPAIYKISRIEAA